MIPFPRKYDNEYMKTRLTERKIRLQRVLYSCVMYSYCINQYYPATLCARIMRCSSTIVRIYFLKLLQSSNKYVCTSLSAFLLIWTGSCHWNITPRGQIDSCEDAKVPTHVQRDRPTVRLPIHPSRRRRKCCRYHGPRATAHHGFLINNLRASIKPRSSLAICSKNRCTYTGKVANHARASAGKNCKGDPAACASKTLRCAGQTFSPLGFCWCA
jgi:hypothetical protein